MAKLFFLLSGENPTLPFSEVKSILKAEGFKYVELGRAEQVLRVEADPHSVYSVRGRSSMARVCCLELFNCKANADIIFREASKTDFTTLEIEETFAVRIKRVKGSSPHINGMFLEKKLGEIILQKTRSSKVDLRHPNKTFFGVLTGDSFFFGLKLAEIKPKEFVERSPRKRIFFHPAAMPAKLARCMVNLAQPRTGEIILDPFCGTGSLLVEAGLIGCRVIGLDVKRRMIEGALLNLLHYGVEPLGVLVGDARYPPIIAPKIDCVVTDPPYGISATTLKVDPRKLYESFLFSIVDYISRGRRICLAAPETLHVADIGESAGLKHIESHFIYVHRRLTREVIVFERV